VFRLEPLEERRLMTLTPVPETTQYPFSAIVEVVAYFNSYDPKVTSEEIAEGTGALVGPHDVLTAAHVIEPSEGYYPDKILVFPGANGAYNRPFGYATVTEVHVNPLYQKSDMNFDDTSSEWDLVMLSLNRDIGSPQLAGWLAFGWVSDQLLNQIVTTQDPIEVPGYPGGNLAHPDLGWLQYVDAGPIQLAPSSAPIPNHFFDPTQWIVYASNQIYTTYGDSGGPVIDNDPAWRVPTILGVVQGGYPGADGTAMGRAVRITQDKYNWLVDAMKGDAAPVDRPQVMDSDNWFNTRKSTFTVSGRAAPGSTIKVNASIWNGGTAKAGTFIVSFYLSRTRQITPSAIRLPVSVTVDSLGPLRTTTVTWKGKLPRNLAKGSYYVGWIIDPNNRVNGYPVKLNPPLGAPSKTGYVRTGQLSVR
jgi:V8-like Glu-specific endopeptidase